MERNRRLRREGVKPGESEKTVMQNFSIRRRTTRSPTPHPVTCGFSSALCGQQPIRPGSTYSGGLRQPPALSFCTPSPSIIAAPLPPDITSPGATHLDRQSNLAATTEHKLAFTCHTKNYQFARAFFSRSQINGLVPLRPYILSYGKGSEMYHNTP